MLLLLLLLLDMLLLLLLLLLLPPCHHGRHHHAAAAAQAAFLCGCEATRSESNCERICSNGCSFLLGGLRVYRTLFFEVKNTSNSELSGAFLESKP